MSEWTCNNNIVYDEDGLAFADCRHQKGRAKQICREHNAHEELVSQVKSFRVFVAAQYPGPNSDYAQFQKSQQALLQHIDTVLANAEGRK